MKLIQAIKPSEINTDQPFLGSEWQKIEREGNARYLVAMMQERGDTFDQLLPKGQYEDDYGLNKDYAFNTICVVVKEDGVRVTDEFVRRVLKFKKS